MDESTSISRTHIIARISDRLITSPILSEWRIPIDQARKTGANRQNLAMICVNLAKIWSCSPFLSRIMAGKAATTFPRSRLSTHRHEGEASGYKGHETRPVLHSETDA